jgi:protein phosphatase
MCQEKHMGSRAIVIVARDCEMLRRRFNTGQGEIGFVYTRTGRPFFEDPTLEQTLLDRLHGALDASGFWEEHSTGWVCLDCELLPWSVKAQELLRSQYAPIGVAATMALSAEVGALAAAQKRGLPVDALLERTEQRAGIAERYITAYRHYCWPVESVDDLRLAPFHLLASDGAAHTDRDHAWHMASIASVAEQAPNLVIATEHRVVDLLDAASQQLAIAWWEELTASGGEGIVVKPMDFVARRGRRLVQPAVKVRGSEYLRIIYGPEYDLPEHLERLRKRNIGLKRSLALREFALGIEALERFARAEPLYRVHECVFAVLALESEPVDPRL